MKIFDKILYKLGFIDKVEYLGRELERAEGKGERIDPILKHSKAGGISVAHLEGALRYADRAGINPILKHPNAGGIRVGQFSAVITYADAEGINLMLKHPNTREITSYLGSTLRNADAERVNLLFNHPNAGGIDDWYFERYLRGALSNADAEGTNLILKHPNANAISLDDIAEALKGNDAKKNAHIIAYLHTRDIAPNEVTDVLASVIIKAAVISGDMALWDKVVPIEHRTEAHLRDFSIYKAIYTKKAINTEFPSGISEKKDELQAAGVSNNLAKLLAYMVQKERETPGAFDVSTMPPHVKEDMLLHAVLEQQLPVFNAAMQPEISHNISTKFIHALSETLAPLIILNRLSNSIAPFAEEMTHSLMKHPNCQLKNNPIVAFAHSKTGPKTQVLGGPGVELMARGLHVDNGLKLGA